MPFLVVGVNTIPSPSPVTFLGLLPSLSQHYLELSEFRACAPTSGKNSGTDWFLLHVPVSEGGGEGKPSIYLNILVLPIPTTFLH